MLAWLACFAVTWYFAATRYTERFFASIPLRTKAARNEAPGFAVLLKMTSPILGSRIGPGRDDLKIPLRRCSAVCKPARSERLTQCRSAGAHAVAAPSDGRIGGAGECLCFAVAAADAEPDAMGTTTSLRRAAAAVSHRGVNFGRGGRSNQGSESKQVAPVLRRIAQRIFPAAQCVGAAAADRAPRLFDDGPLRAPFPVKARWRRARRILLHVGGGLGRSRGRRQCGCGFVHGITSFVRK